VHTARLRDAETISGLLDDALSLFDGERLERFVLESRDLTAIVMVAYPALKTDVAAAAAIFDTTA